MNFYKIQTNLQFHQGNQLFSWDVGEWVSEVAQLCPTLCDPMDCSLPGSSIHGIFQARILEWVAISFSRRSSRPRDWTQVSHIVGRRFTVWATREVLGSQVYAKTTVLPLASLPVTPESSAFQSPCSEPGHSSISYVFSATLLSLGERKKFAWRKRVDWERNT